VKKVTFNGVKIQNFLSVGKEPIEIEFKKGIFIITGENKDKGGKNGIGKSTIADAIFWCLFGNTIRELKKDKIQHDKSNDECKVTLTFSIETPKNKTDYVLTRTLNPGKVELLSEGGQRYHDLTLSTIPKTDEYIKQLIGANEEVFNNAVIMSANNTLPFMAQKKTDKRKFIEGILQLNIFSDMLLKTRAEHNETKKQNDILSNNFIGEQRILSSLMDSKSNFDGSKDERIKNIKTKLILTNNDFENLKNKNVTDVISLKEEIKKFEEKKEKLSELLKENNQKTVDIGNEYSEIYDELRDAKNDKKKILDKGNTCPTCNRIYCKEDLDHVASEIKKLEDTVASKQPIHDSLLNKKKESENFSKKIVDNIDNVKDKIKDLKDDISAVALHEQKIKSLNEKIEEYKENITEIESETFKDDVKIKICEDNIKKLESDLIEIKKNIAILDSVKFIVSEEGVKAFIVKKIMGVFNSKLNHYLKTLDAPCKCIFDETFEETLYNEQNKECSYFNFSGGERKRIDTAILFTFQDILRFHSGTSFSLNIYDELFDSALDDKGVDKILDILKNKVDSYGESVYIISHKNNTRSNVDGFIFLEKSNGATKLLK
jgi:DNA repair exonuclease SbcCD ATPase subunit